MRIVITPLFKDWGSYISNELVIEKTRDETLVFLGAPYVGTISF